MDFISADSKLNVDGSRVSFSGFRSGIDFQGVVDALIEARRFPIDRLESQVETRTNKLTAYQAMEGKLSAVKDSLANLYGALSIDDSRDVFEAKQAFTSTSRSDGTTPAQAANLLSVNVSNAATATDHQLEILQVAQAQKAAADTVADPDTARGLSGSFDVNGVTVSVNTADTLRDIQSKLDAADDGATPSEVSASLVQASATEHTLVLTADSTGDPIEFTDTDGVLTTLGVIDGTGAVKNELQAAQQAKVKADGLTVADALQSDPFPDPLSPLNAASTDGTETFTITDVATSELYTIDYDESVDSLTDIANRIDMATGGSGGDNISAAVVEENGGFRLQITRDGGGTLTAADTTGSLTTDVGLAAATDVERVITRSSNTIDDLFNGVTLDLFQAEPGSTVNLEIEADLNGVKSAITDFVNAYNGAKQYINAQRQDLELEGMADGEAGALFRDRTLAQVESELNSILANGAQGGDGFDVLAQIGIEFADSSAISNSTQRDTLTIDETKLNDALLNDLDRVRDLFAFDITTTSGEINLLGFGENSQHNATGDHTLYVETDGSGNVTYAEINGVPADVSGNRITGAAGSGGGEDVSLFYSGAAATLGKTINFNVSTGIASEMNFAIDRLTGTDGPLDSEMDAIKDQNRQAETRIERDLERLEYQRERLLARFVEMERQLAEMDRIKESLSQLMLSVQGNN
jgi:flagellar hook-associated protein 2